MNLNQHDGTKDGTRKRDFPYNGLGYYLALNSTKHKDAERKQKRKRENVWILRWIQCHNSNNNDNKSKHNFNDD